MSADDARRTPTLAVQDLCGQLQDLEDQRVTGTSSDAEILDAALERIYDALGVCLGKALAVTVLCNALVTVSTAIDPRGRARESALRTALAACRGLIRCLPVDDGCDR
jgi:hypothetical protein